MSDRHVAEVSGLQLRDAAARAVTPTSALNAEGPRHIAAPVPRVPPSGFRNALNDIMQHLHRREDLIYSDEVSGPERQPTYETTVYFAGRTYRRASGNSKLEAKELAAKEAYEALMKEDGIR